MPVINTVLSDTPKHNIDPNAHENMGWVTEDGNVATASKLKISNIPNNSDLNDYKTAGVYAIISSSYTIANKPGEKAGILYVSNTESASPLAFQVFFEYSTSTTPCKIYYRGYYNTNDVWSEWASIANKEELPIELDYLDGVTSNIQTQLNGKAASSHNHSASNITSGTLPIARGGTGATTAANALKALGLTATAAELNKLDGAKVTVSEINYLDGVTSNIQTQLNSKLSKSGGTMTGALTLSGDPTEDLHAATKQYVDNNSSGSPIRHIQRGVVEVGRSPANVTLSGFSNIDKMIVLINGVNSGYNSSTGVSTASGHIGVINSISKLTISQSNTSSPVTTESNVSYQVIEFI